jgi:excisionase family DNA binding protein
MANRPGGGRFAFIDAGEAARRLGVDRLTIDRWVKDGRIKPYRVGPGVFFRVTEVEAIYKELHPDAELAQAIASDESESTGTTKPIGLVKRQQDPQMRVYLRLQADAKWYDISDDDIRAWFQQLAPEGYDRNKRNAEHTIKKLQLIVSLIEEAKQRKKEMQE